MELAGIHTVGPKFTWSRSGFESKLNRILVNNMFMELYLNAMATLLFNFKSYHNPTLIQAKRQERCACMERLFRFEASWLMHNGFDEFIEEAWSNEKVGMIIL